ncbi:MAG: hypothetical protein GY823_09610 [Flavobacteriaceae bacterium]|nr:hypothetical protein [Flavobacteriaceae bacterium]
MYISIFASCNIKKQNKLQSVTNTVDYLYKEYKYNPVKYTCYSLAALGILTLYKYAYDNWPIYISYLEEWGYTSRKIKWKEDDIDQNIRHLPRVLIGNGKIKESFGFEIPGIYEVLDDDITIDTDINKHPDIIGKFEDIKTYNQLLQELQNKKVKAIIIERVDIPIYYERYLFTCLKNNDYNNFYDITNYEFDEKYISYNRLSKKCKMTRIPLKASYKMGNSFYLKDIKTEKIDINLDFLKTDLIKPIPSLCYVFNKSNSLCDIDNLEDILYQHNITKKENNCLTRYYNILAKGGKLIYKSTSSGINRHGFCFRYKNKNFGLFENLDDDRLKEIYSHIFQKAGFSKIDFFKDEYYYEDSICLIAYKKGIAT